MAPTTRRSPTPKPKSIPSDERKLAVTEPALPCVQDPDRVARVEMPPDERVALGRGGLAARDETSLVDAAGPGSATSYRLIAPRTGSRLRAR